MEYDSSNWLLLPKKAEQTRDDPIYDGNGRVIGFNDSIVLDANPGWIAQLCIQGIVFMGDDYAMYEPGDGSVIVASRSDNADLYDQIHLRRFWPEIETRTYTKGTVVATSRGPKVEFELYVPNQYVANLNERFWGDAVTAKDITTFVRPVETLMRYGLFVTDDEWDAHRALAEPKSYKEWFG